MENPRLFLVTYRTMQRLVDTDGIDWSTKYDKIFGEYAPKIREAGVEPDWWSDTTYREDVNTYMGALKPFVDKAQALLKFEDGNRKERVRRAARQVSSGLDLIAQEIELNEEDQRALYRVGRIVRKCAQQDVGIAEERRWDVDMELRTVKVASKLGVQVGDLIECTNGCGLYEVSGPAPFTQDGEPGFHAFHRGGRGRATFYPGDYTKVGKLVGSLSVKKKSGQS